MSLFKYLNKNRPDVTWLKGPDIQGHYIWDQTLADQQQISDLIQNYNVDNDIDLYELDLEKYEKRAGVKNQIIARMASNNMERVRNGVWTVTDLIELTQDTELKLVLDDVNTLSFELAVSKIQNLTTPLVTVDIKNEWINILASHLYNN